MAASSHPTSFSRPWQLRVARPSAPANEPDHDVDTDTAWPGPAPPRPGGCYSWSGQNARSGGCGFVRGGELSSVSSR